MVKCGAVTIFNQSLGGVAETYPIGQYVKHSNMYVDNKEKHTFKVESRDENQAIQSEEGNEITDCHNMTDDIGSQENADKNNCHPEETTDNNFEGNNYCDDPDKKVAENIFKKIIKTENKTGEESSLDGYLQFLDSLNSIFETSQTPSVAGEVGDVRMEESSRVADDGSEELEGGREAGVSEESGEVTYNPSKILSREPKSFCWQFYVFKQAEDKTLDTTKVFCKVCSKSVPYSGGTTNLRAHIKNDHLKEYVKATGKCCSYSSCRANKPVKGKKGMKHTIQPTQLCKAA